MMDKRGTYVWEVPNEILFEEVCGQLSQGQNVVINVRGWSMHPFIDGDRDRVELQPVTSLKVGDVALACLVGGVYVLHRVMAVENEFVVLMGDGNVVGTEHCRLADVRAIAVKVIRPNGKEIDLTSPASRFHARLWRSLLPFRRYLLAFYRRILLPLK